MNKRYLDLMEKTLSAYTEQHILRYFDDVKSEGLTEHGFPRLTSNIGILIANGRRCELMPVFLEMMEFCCKTIPCVKAANDFSVREIVCCIYELEKNQTVSVGDIARWKESIASIVPEKCYNVYATEPTSPVRNWALFSGVSEYFRQGLVGCDSTEFIDLQVASQLQWFDENGMYMDNPDNEAYQPIQYDIVPRGLFAILLFAGYKGKYYSEVDAILKKAGLLTLNLQSEAGEMGFGGRSNQFLHNEAWTSMIFEYEALRYKKEGDLALAGKFKAAADRALKSLELWLSKSPISHVKNRFPIDTKFGCEEYAYFDKYMITVASFLYAAQMFCDESIAPVNPDEAPMIWSTSKHFHKTFAKAGGYSLEFDTNADPHYDASGLGSIQKNGAPCTICLAMPFAKNPHYELSGYENKSAFSICPAVKDERGEWYFCADSDAVYSVIEEKVGEDKVELLLECRLPDGETIKFSCVADKGGVALAALTDAQKEVGIALPVFDFDGEAHTNIVAANDNICVEYAGWVCEYAANRICDMQTSFANRNGIYKGYIASGTGNASVRISIYEKI